MAKKYIVGVREVHVVYVEVEAESPEHAINKVKFHDYENEFYTVYSHTLDPSNWSVEERGCQ